MEQQLSDQSLREMAQRIQALLGMCERLPDRGRMLLAKLDAIHREQDRRQARGDGGEAGPGDEEKEEAGRAEAEVMAQQLSDQSLREKAQGIQGLLNPGILERLPDRGRKLLATLVAFHREQDRRKARGDGGEAGSVDKVKKEAERAETWLMAQQLSDQSLREKAQGIQALLNRGISERLSDRGRKLRATLNAIHREEERRQARGDGARTPGNEACERIVQPRCTESSGLQCDLSRVEVSVADFMSSFGTNKQAGINISSLEIKGRCPYKPSTSIENKGKLCEEKDSCEASSQPMNSLHEELHLDTSQNMGKTSSCDASNSNGHNRICKEVPISSRKRGYPQQGGFRNSIGQEAAKAQCKEKRKVDEVKDGISMLGDNINKIVEIVQGHKQDREKVTEAQLEISRNQLTTAIEQKEAKLLEAYTLLLVQDTSKMTQEAKATRNQALASLTHKLFGKASTAI